MKYNVTMPSLGADMDEGKLMDWKIAPGDHVKKGQTMAIVETTKSAVEIESFREGKVLELVGKAGEVIPVGQIIAYFDVEGAPSVEEQSPAPVKGRVKISPAARKLAQEKHIDLEKIKGSGPQGQIELKDIESLGAPVPSGVNIREAIARAMAQSKKEIPHYYLKNRIGLDPLMNWLDQKNAALAPEKRLMVPVVLFRAIIKSLKEFPQLNGHFKNGHFDHNEAIHLGVTIALKTGGVLVPALLDAHLMTMEELNISFQDLLLRTKNGELRNRELTEGSVTVTNVGDLGSDEVFGIIFPPQVCLIGLGKIHTAAVVDGPTVRPGLVIDVTLSADHRVTDGLTGARFMSLIEKNLMHPSLLEE